MKLQPENLAKSAELRYEKKPLCRGYAMRTLKIDLCTGSIVERPVSKQMKEKFVGGKGFGLKLLWDATTPETVWDDPENEIVIAMGPLCGNTNYSGSGKSLVVSLSPLTGIPIDSNVGGFFGPFLKFSGFDALELAGKAEREVIIFIDGDQGSVQIFEAPESLESDTHILAEKLTHAFSASENDEDLAAVAVVSAGRGAEHSRIGLLNFSLFDRRRGGCRVKQAGRGGIGTVFRDKRIKALVCRYSHLGQDDNHAADPAAVQRLGLKLHREIVLEDDKQSRMRRIGTAHLMEVMNDYDLLPVKNHRFGQDPEAEKLASWVWEKKFSQGLPDGCWYGCTLACAHAVDQFELKTGPYKGQKVCVDGPEYETAAGVGSNLAIWEPEEVLEINFYCDTYGIDTISFGTIVGFLMECWEYGILNQERSQGIKLEWGNWRAACEILHRMAAGKDFGVLAGRGTRYLADYFVEHYGADPGLMKDIALHGKGLEQSQYISKESLAQQGGYYLTNKGPQHDEAWLIFMDMVNNRIPSFEQKAEALHYFPMFRTWFGLQGLCKLPWNDIEPADNAKWEEPSKVPEHVDNYRELYTAITGEPLSKTELIRQSERVYNFQRVFNLRMGRGKREDDYPPYRAVGPVTELEYLSRAERYDAQLKEKQGLNPAAMSLGEKIAVTRKFRESQYESLVDAVYKRRGWTAEGIPRAEHLAQIGMDLPELLDVIRRQG
ncbi:MAG: aldehyde ferredoxin oxidoreductase C-terminal domain-containing protein [Spirochaetia bacterium]|jgi:aldehyde:ferredoxin oxidoreductase|nr:aldehyde ferredoxin oxidoreductase C-terminal domain-containing protein [Spirochaetia bacterium]